MSLGLPGVQPKEKCKLKLKKFILCQQVKDNRGDKKPTSIGGNGRKTLAQCSKVLNDGLWSGIKGEARIKYHVNTCCRK